MATLLFYLGHSIKYRLDLVVNFTLLLTLARQHHRSADKSIYLMIQRSGCSSIHTSDQ